MDVCMQGLWLSKGVNLSSNCKAVSCADISPAGALDHVEEAYMRACTHFDMSCTDDDDDDDDDDIFGLFVTAIASTFHLTTILHLTVFELLAM